MTARVAPKKSESIEIRLSFEAKSAFTAQCNAEHRTASEVLRAFIEERSATGTTTALAARRGIWRTLAAGIAGLALGLGVAAPSLAEGLDTTPHNCTPHHAPTQR